MEIAEGLVRLRAQCNRVLTTQVHGRIHIFFFCELYVSWISPFWHDSGKFIGFSTSIHSFQLVKKCPYLFKSWKRIPRFSGRAPISILPYACQIFSPEPCHQLISPALSLPIFLWSHLPGWLCLLIPCPPLANEVGVLWRNILQSNERSVVNVENIIELWLRKKLICVTSCTC